MRIEFSEAQLALQTELRGYFDELMTPELVRTLTAHAANNLRVLNKMAAELLVEAAEQNLSCLDESLFLELFSPTASTPRRKASAGQ